MKLFNGWNNYLLKLRIKTTWLYELFCLVIGLLAVILAIVPIIASNFSHFQPVLANEALYEDAKRISFLSVSDEIDMKNVRMATGHIEYDSDYYFVQTYENKNAYLQIDSASFIDKSLVSGRLPTSVGEAVLSTDEPMNDEFIPFILTNLSNNFGLPASYLIVGSIYMQSMYPTLFLSDEDFSVTSLYQDYKVNLRFSDSSISLSNDLLVFDPGLEESEVSYSGNVQTDEFTVTFLSSLKSVKVIRESGSQRKVLRINPSLFPRIEGREYVTIIFDDYQSKKDFLSERQLLNLYDRFSPEGGANMVISLIYPYFYTLFILLYIPLFILMVGLSCKTRKFDRAITQLGVKRSSIVVSDLVCGLITQFLSLILSFVLILTVTKAFNSSTTLGYISSTAYLSITSVWIFATVTILVFRWRSHEIR